ncbi:hypothetical protein [Sphingomonas sp.]|uniref:hypothetical protein n=1 Tax=Sphingomonas sp. TaxID=28214 RepID=UPI00286A1DF8|nr:hypothetical protein [Sphingomonas sp.]
MARKTLAVALSIIVVASPVWAASRETNPQGPSPTASAGAKYCMHLEPYTGSLIETVRCWTRAEWAEQGVDVDKEWAKEGVTVIQ